MIPCSTYRSITVRIGADILAPQNAHRFAAILLAVLVAALTLSAALVLLRWHFSHRQPPQVLLAVSGSRPGRDDPGRDDNAGFRVENSVTGKAILPSFLADAVPKEIARVPGASADLLAAVQEHIYRDMYALAPDSARLEGSPAHLGHDLAHSFDLTIVSDFGDIGAALTAISAGSAAWGDYDNDSDLDILLIGHFGGVNYAKVYRNDGGGTFTDIGAGLTGTSRVPRPGVTMTTTATWTSCLRGLPVLRAKIYRNDGDGSLYQYQLRIWGFIGSVAWGDYDNDGDLDILLTGLDAAGSPLSPRSTGMMAAVSLPTSALGCQEYAKSPWPGATMTTMATWTSC